MELLNLPNEMIREILKYSPWKSRGVSKTFNQVIDDDDSRFLKMELDKKSNTPFFNGQKFLTPKLPFAKMLKWLDIIDCPDL
jgi:hypothetical protein